VGSLVTDQGIIHYEFHGRGRPVLLLHGWLGSWQLYRNTIEVLGRDFRTYALDFWGFGESDRKGAVQLFEVDNFVEMVYQFMDRLGIAKAPLIGHSMGGTVSLSTAIRYPEKVVKVVVIGSPIQGTSLNFFLKLAGIPYIAALLFRFPILLKAVIGMIAYFLSTPKDRMMLTRMIMSDLSQVEMNAFFQSIGTLHRTDLRPVLDKVRAPTLGIYGRWDMIVHPNQSKALQAGVKHAQIAWYKDAGHFPMMDDPDRFIGDLHSFLVAKHT
jgi:pimeloyl-ACP methyl ester carboxylesterase